MAELTDVRVFIALPAHRDYPPDFVLSLAATFKLFHAAGVEWVLHQVRDQPIAYARSILCHEFLKTDCTHILWLDSDMCWTAEDILRLTALCTEMDVIATPNVGRRDGSPVTFKPFHGNKSKPNEWGCIAVQRTGFAVSYMSRKLVQDMSDRCEQTVRVFKDQEPFKNMFCYSRIENGDVIGEDFAFSDDLRAAGYELFIDPMTTPGHVGSKIWRAPNGTK